VQAHLADVGVKLLLIPKISAELSSERIHEPEPGVVQGTLVFFLGITEAGDDANRFGHGVAILNDMGNKKTAVRRSFRVAW
jgi:hypothetical protein